MISDLEDVEAIRLYPKPRPQSADDPASPDSRAMAVGEWTRYAQWPWDLEVDTADGTRYLYGRDAHEWITRWLALHPAR